MGNSLGYDFDETHIKKSIYAPQGHADLESEQRLIRKGIIDVLYRGYALPMEIKNWPQDENNNPKQ